MDSGGVLSVGPAEEPHRQLLFDRFAAAAGCNVTTDEVLTCLRNVSSLVFRQAQDTTNNDNGLHFSYGPSFDEKCATSHSAEDWFVWLTTGSSFFLDTPQNLLLQGQHVNVPFINGGWPSHS